MDFLEQEIKSMEGKLLGIGITSEKIKSAIMKNDKILQCDLLEEPKGFFGGKKFKQEKRKFSKKVNIKKIRKKYKKKKIDNVICSYKTIKKYKRTFVKDSVYINKGTLYIYGNKEALKELSEKYKRYTSKVRLTKSGDTNILIVDNRDTKNSRIKDFWYGIVDLFYWIVDALTGLLAN